MPCAKCGECCKWVYILASIPKIIDSRYIEAHGIETQTNWPFFVYMIPCRCKHLTTDNLCEIYENRPESCKQFPMGTDKLLIPEECKYEV